MLELADVHTYYGNIRALRGISLSVAPGEIVTLIGANGAGKTTTLRTILGTVRARHGTVSFNGHQLDTLTTDRIVRLGIAQSPEGRRIFPRMTVLENLELGAFARPDRAAIASDLQRVFTLFPRLAERTAQSGGTLSGGEQQMLAIGRALMARPTLLLLDEPSMGLSPILVETIFRIVQDINRQGTTILLVEQNARMALRVSHRGYVIQTGRIVLHDAAPSLLRSDLVRKTYPKNCPLSAPRMPVCSIPALSFLTPLQWPPLGLKRPSRVLPPDDMQAWLRLRLRSRPRLLLLGAVWQATGWSQESRPVVEE